MEQHELRTGGFSRPSEFLRSVETRAIRIRKLLASSNEARKAQRTSGSMDDAVQLADLIERLSRYGQTIAAADAIAVADYVDLLVDILKAKVDALLTS